MPQNAIFSQSMPLAFARLIMKRINCNHWAVIQKPTAHPMDPTVKRLASGQASQSWMVSQCQKQDTKQRKEAVAEKVNKPNNKQNPQAQNRHCEKGQLRNVDGLCITESAVWRETLKKFNEGKRHRHTERHVGWISSHGESSMDCVSILFQFLSWCTLSITIMLPLH